MDFTKLLCPREPIFEEILQAIWSERSDLREAYSDPDTPGYRKWAAANGMLEYPERLARFYPPLPPLELRQTACGGKTENAHLFTAIEHLETVLGLFELFGDKPISEIASTLDFGCGCGRAMRWLPLALPGAIWHGVDVRGDCIDWCSANLQGSFVKNDTLPPLSHLADDSIDLIFSLSVFSHLNRDTARAWIAELSRVCKPNGRIIASTCGAFCLWVIVNSPEHQREILAAEPAKDYLRRLATEDFIFHELEQSVLAKLDGVESSYGLTFLTESFVRNEWAAHCEVLAYVPATLSLLQDFFVLRPK
jgi:SAM-dependent methyltransferase